MNIIYFEHQSRDIRSPLPSEGEGQGEGANESPTFSLTALG